jgi:hypothetical protein
MLHGRDVEAGVQPRVSTGQSIHAVLSITPSPREGIEDALAENQLEDPGRRHQRRPTSPRTPSDSGSRPSRAERHSAVAVAPKATYVRLRPERGRAALGSVGRARMTRGVREPFARLTGEGCGNRWIDYRASGARAAYLENSMPLRWAKANTSSLPPRSVHPVVPCRWISAAKGAGLLNSACAMPSRGRTARTPTRSRRLSRRGA